MSRVAVYAGSFDPPTIGHEDIVCRAAPMFDTLYVAIGHNPDKTPYVPLGDRLEMLRESFCKFDNVVVAHFTGLLVNFCNLCSARYIVRGVRNAADFEYEQSLACVNATQNPDIETLLLMAKPQLSFVSSSAVKALRVWGGDTSRFLSPHVEKYLTVEKYPKLNR